MVNLRVSRLRGQPLTVTSSKRTPAEGRESLLFGVFAGPPSVDRGARDKLRVAVEMFDDMGMEAPSD
jgi:hypothetical protein